MTYYAIDYGHNTPPKDIGVNGIEFEDELVNQVGDVLVKLLRDAGHKILLTRPNKASSVRESLNERCNKANNAGVEKFISIHFNSFTRSANGTEVWVASPNSKFVDEAALVVQNIAKLGFTNRGVKCGNFRVLVGTNMPAMLIECCFVSSAKDMKLFNPEKNGISYIQRTNR